MHYSKKFISRDERARCEIKYASLTRGYFVHIRFALSAEFLSTFLISVSLSLSLQCEITYLYCFISNCEANAAKTTDLLFRSSLTACVFTRGKYILHTTVGCFNADPIFIYKRQVICVYAGLVLLSL